MKISKIEGLKMIKLLDIPTVKLIDPNLLDENSQVLKQGLSVRTSPKRDLSNNVYLPSIHNCTDLGELRRFIKQYKEQYHMIVHRTVKPNEIGSISRYEAGEDKIIIETFEDFENRKKGVIKNRMILPIRGEKFIISQLQIQKQNEQDFYLFSEVIKKVKTIPFKKFDAEFVVEEGKILFMELTMQSTEYIEEVKRRTPIKPIERNRIK